MNLKNDKSTEEMIKEKGLTAPRVTKEMINSKIKDVELIEHETESGFNIMIGCFYMQNGFTVTGTPIITKTMQSNYVINPTGEIHIITHITKSGSVLRWAYKEFNECGLFAIGRPSASVSPANDNREIGEKIAIENMNRDVCQGWATLAQPIDDNTKEEAQINAFNEIWAFEGYQLATRLHNDGGYLKELHLCNDCIYEFATCEAKEIAFGKGKGNDNVISCSGFKKPVDEDKAYHDTYQGATKE